MADNKAQVTASITAQNTFTDWLQLRASGQSNREYRGLHHALLSISGTFSATVTLQYKLPGEADGDARDVATTYTAGDAKLVEWAGEADLRVGVKTGDFTSGTVELMLTGTNYEGA